MSLEDMVTTSLKGLHCQTLSTAGLWMKFLISLSDLSMQLELMLTVHGGVLVVLTEEKQEEQLLPSGQA